MEIEDIKAIVVSMIKANNAVWMGVDVGKCSDSKLGIMDTSKTWRSELSTRFFSAVLSGRIARLPECIWHVYWYD